MEVIDKNVLALPGARRACAVLGAASFADALACVGQAWCLARAIVGLWEGGALAAQLGWVGAFAACYLVRQLVAYARSAYMDRYSRARAGELRRAALGRMLEEGPAFVQRQGTGAATTSLLEGADQIRTYVGLIIPKVADLLVIPPVLVIALFALDWVSGLIALLAFPCAVLFMGLLGSVAKENARRQRGAYRALANHFVDTLRGIGTLKLFGRAHERGEQVFQTSERFREATVETLRVATLSSLVLDLVGTFTLAAVAIMLGFRLIDGSIAFLPALAALVVVPEYFGAIRRYSVDFHASLDGRTALAAMGGLLEDGKTPPHDAPTPRSPIAAWGDSSRLRLRNVGCAYGEAAAPPALHGVDLELAGCEKVGVVGASGAGKSTLVRLLAGFLEPADGEISVDGTPCFTLHRPDWLAQVTYIPQSPHVFSATLRENIAFYRPDADEGDLRRAVEAMGLAQLVDELPQGLDTPIGEGGRALSGGQAQRVALARALLDRRRILVFDEPTAHLDIETELDLKGCMLPLMEGRLVLFATHRLHWLADMDRIVVLEGGAVVQQGTLDELRVQGGAFARLAHAAEGGGRW